MTDRFDVLPQAADPLRRAAARWLKLSMLVLLASGAYSVVLLMPRVPVIGDHFGLGGFGEAAAVVRAELSAVLWPLALAGVLWSLNLAREHWLWDRVPLWLVSSGAGLIAVSPLLGARYAVMASYVPVLRDPIFFAGGWLAMGGLALLVLRAMIGSRPLSKPLVAGDVLGAGIWFSAFAGVVVGLALVWSSWAVPGDLAPEAYFGLLLWGAGHVAQLAFILLLVIAWVWLADAAGIRTRLSPRGGVNLMAVALTPVLVVPVIYVSADVLSALHREAFTRLIQYGALTALPLGAVVVLGSFSGRASPAPGQRCLRSALYGSLILFCAALGLAFMTQGAGPILAAYSEGPVPGLTLAFMGLTYDLLPRLGCAAPMLRSARVQPYVYAAGQLMQILGTALRSEYGGSQPSAATSVLHTTPERLGIALTGLGEPIATVGLALFLVVAMRSFRLRARAGGA